MIDFEYAISDDNIKIFDSCHISKKYFTDVLNKIRKENPDNNVVLHRKNCGMKMEWATHNMAYMLNFKTDHSENVDLNYPQKWYIKVMYAVLGAISMIFIK